MQMFGQEKLSRYVLIGGVPPAFSFAADGVDELQGTPACLRRTPPCHRTCNGVVTRSGYHRFSTASHEIVIYESYVL